MKRTILALALTVAGASAAMAADMPVKAPYAPPPAANWTDFYIGGFLGGAWTSSNYCAFSGAGFNCANYKADSFIGGGYLGFEYELPDRVVVGARVSAPFGSFNRSAAAAPVTVMPLGGLAPGSTISGQEQYAVLADATFGYDMGAWLPYAGVGVAFAGTQAKIMQPGVGTDSATEQQVGLDLLVGIRYAVTRNWTVGVQYNHLMFGRTDYQFTGPASGFGGGPGSIPIAITANTAAATLDYRF